MEKIFEGLAILVFNAGSYLILVREDRLKISSGVIFFFFAFFLAVSVFWNYLNIDNFVIIVISATLLGMHLLLFISHRLFPVRSFMVKMLEFVFMPFLILAMTLYQFMII
jgi:hypothetical protein